MLLADVAVLTTMSCQVGWSKATELVKVARKDGSGFDSATWLRKATELPKEGFKQAVEPVFCEDITPRSQLLRAHVSIPWGSPLLRFVASFKESVQGAPAPAAPGTFPTLSL